MEHNQSGVWRAAGHCVVILDELTLEKTRFVRERSDRVTMTGAATYLQLAPGHHRYQVYIDVYEDGSAQNDTETNGDISA